MASPIFGPQTACLLGPQTLLALSLPAKHWEKGPSALGPLSARDHRSHLTNSSALGDAACDNGDPGWVSWVAGTDWWVSTQPLWWMRHWGHYPISMNMKNDRSTNQWSWGNKYIYILWGDMAQKLFWISEKGPLSGAAKRHADLLLSGSVPPLQRLCQEAVLRTSSEVRGTTSGAHLPPSQLNLRPFKATPTTLKPACQERTYDPRSSTDDLSRSHIRPSNPHARSAPTTLTAQPTTLQGHTYDPQTRMSGAHLRPPQLNLRPFKATPMTLKPACQEVTTTLRALWPNTKVLAKAREKEERLKASNTPPTVVRQVLALYMVSTLPKHTERS